MTLSSIGGASLDGGGESGYSDDDDGGAGAALPCRPRRQIRSLPEREELDWVRGDAQRQLSSSTSGDAARWSNMPLLATSDDLDSTVRDSEVGEGGWVPPYWYRFTITDTLGTGEAASYGLAEADDGDYIHELVSNPFSPDEWKDCGPSTPTTQGLLTDNDSSENGFAMDPAVPKTAAAANQAEDAATEVSWPTTASSGTESQSKSSSSNSRLATFLGEQVPRESPSDSVTTYDVEDSARVSSPVSSLLPHGLKRNAPPLVYDEPSHPQDEMFVSQHVTKGTTSLMSCTPNLLPNSPLSSLIAQRDEAACRIQSVCRGKLTRHLLLNQVGWWIKGIDLSILYHLFQPSLSSFYQIVTYLH